MNSHDIMNKKLSVIVPVYNGEKFIAENLEIIRNSFKKYFNNLEIIVVIDGMTDNSKQEALKTARKYPDVKIVAYKENKGKGNAIKTGFEHSTGDYITFIDCDIDIHPEQVKNFLPYLATADVIIGSKRHPFSKLNYPLSRRILSRGFQLYSFIILHTGLRDTQSGFKLIKREVLEIIMPLLLVKRYAFDLELCFLAKKHGFRVVEAPLHIDFQGNSSLSKTPTSTLKTARGMFMDVLAIRYRYSILKYYQNKFWESRGWNGKEENKRKNNKSI